MTNDRSGRLPRPSTKIRILLSLILLVDLESGELRAATLHHVEKADPATVVVVIHADPLEPAPSQLVSDWKVGNRSAQRVGRNTEVFEEGTAQAGFPMMLEHRLYVEFAAPLPQASIEIQTPYGPLVFSNLDDEILAESIKVNQAGYASPDGAAAVVAVTLGDLGPKALDPLPDATLVSAADGNEILAVELVELGLDSGGAAPSGDHVHRLSLAQAPPGGPYYLTLPGHGRSHPFSIGKPAASAVARTVFRGLYHQRCGIALESAHTSFTRASCHESVQVTDAEPPGFITLAGARRPIHGGYHDAGDFDRRQYHTLIPAWLMTFHEAYPEVWPDGSLDIPESGNGIPDGLDEALWGVRVWEQLQEADGGVRAGTESNAHPAYGVVNAASDTLIYRTYRRDAPTTAVAAGLFAQAARLLQPYSVARSDEFLDRAQRAWQWLEMHPATPAAPAQRMYAALQLWLATGDAQFHQVFAAMTETLNAAPWPQQYHVSYFSLTTYVDGMVFAPYFYSYLIAARPTDDEIRARVLQWLLDAVARMRTKAESSKYPVGAPTSASWGALTNQGRYAEPLIYLYRLTADPALRREVQAWADYPLGVNPLGRSFITGVGAAPIRAPLHLDSFFTAERGLGPVPGLTIFGPFENPSNVEYQAQVWREVYPAWTDRPAARRYTEGWSLVPVNEFATVDTLALNAVMYSFLVADAAIIFRDGFEHP